MNIELLMKCGKTVSFERNQVICKEGEVGNSMYIVLRGMVDIVINSFSDKAKTVAQIKEGGFFGEMSLLEDIPRTATVYAKSEQVIVLEVGKSDFPKLLRHADSIAYNMFSMLKKRLDEMLELVRDKEKRYVYQYRKKQLYETIQKMDEESFSKIATENPDYVWTLLKYLSTALKEQNLKYIDQVEG